MKKVKIFSNSAMSVDGKLSSRLYEHPTWPSCEDRKKMSFYRAQADAILIGGNTFRLYQKALIENEKYGFVSTREKKMLNIVVSRTGYLPTQAPMYMDERVIPLIVTTDACDQKKFPSRVHFFQNTNLRMTQLVEFLSQKYGISSLLIEAGGDVIFQFLQENLLDDMFITLCPFVFGGKTAPSLVAGEGFLAQDKRIVNLQSCHHVGEELFLHYRVKR